MHQDSINIVKEINEKYKEKKIVFVCGNFNIVHPGHLRLLRFASECGDILIVGVYPDSSAGAILPESLRLEGVRSISWVNYAFILKDKPEIFIRQLKPDFVVKGKEHENRFNPELEAVKSYNGKLVFSSGDVTFSSIELLKDEIKNVNLSTVTKPQDFPARHGFSMNNLVEIIGKMRNLTVLVIGDTIVDEYITCDPIGMSQEDPTIVVTPIFKEQFIGAAGIVSEHAKGLGADVHFFSVVGKDETSDYVRKTMEDYGVNLHLYKDDSRHTTRKQRFRAGNKTLLRVNYLHQHGINKEIQKEILKDISQIIKEINLLIFSDFNYGCLPQNLVDEIITLCKKNGVLTVADSQSSSQIGDVSRYKGMCLLTPTEREARLAVRDFNSGLVVLAEQLREKADAKNILLTLGAEGVLIHAYINSNNKWLTDRLPAFNTSPKDISGAGDSMLIGAAMALAVGSDIWQSTYIGSICAACQIGRIGNIPLTRDEIIKEIES